MRRERRGTAGPPGPRDERAPISRGRAGGRSIPSRRWVWCWRESACWCSASACHMTKIAVRGLDPTVAAVGRAAVASVLRARRPGDRQAAATQRGRSLAGLVLVVGGVILGFPILIAYALRHTGEPSRARWSTACSLSPRLGSRCSAPARRPSSVVLGLQRGRVRRCRCLRGPRRRRDAARRRRAADPRRARGGRRIRRGCAARRGNSVAGR